MWNRDAMQTRAILVLSLSLLLFACGDEETPTAPARSEFRIPLEVGSAWSYQISTDPLSLGAAGDSTVVVEVTAMEVVNGLAFSVLTEGADTTLARQEGDDLYLIPAEYRNMDPTQDQISQWLAALFAKAMPMRYLDPDVLPGWSWILAEGADSYFLDADEVVVTLRMTAENMTRRQVLVPAGTFECAGTQVHLETRWAVGGDLVFRDERVQNFFFANDVGIVQVAETREMQEYPDPAVRTETVRSLTSFVIP